MKPLPNAFAASEEQFASHAADWHGGSSEEFHGRTGAEWVLWRALRSHGTRLIHNSALLFDEPLTESASL